MSDHNQYYNMFNNSENDEFLENEKGKENDELLIDAVRAYPHLYNHQNRNFKDHLMKENSWKEIALAVNSSVSDCQNRWVRLRERFGKEKRQRELDSKSGSGVSQRSGFTYYENMSFLNDHIKRRKSYTNVSSVKRIKTMDVPANKPDTHISPTSSLFTIKKDNQINLPMDSAIIENTESSMFKIASQLSNVGDAVPMQPSVQLCTNFSTQFKNNSLLDTSPVASSMNSLENDHSSSSTSSKCFPNTLSIFDESEESTLFSTRESTPSPALKSLQATPVSRQPPCKKKDNSGALESSLILLCQTMHQRLQNNRNSEITGSSDETFARLITNQLEKLPSHEKYKRQQAIIQILYEPYNS